MCACIDQGQCFLLYVNITQCRSDQTIFIIVCTIACCIMSHFGRLEEFDCSSTDINSCFERLHAFYSANNVHDSAKVNVFFSVVGPKTYKFLKSLIAPTLPSDKTIDELYQTLKWHVQPMDSVISRRARFYTRKQKDAESVTDFVAELKLLAAECEFDAFLDQASRDILAIGIADRETQRKLREAKTFTKAIEIALAHKSISQELSDTSDKDVAGGMHALGHSSSGQAQQPQPARSKRGWGGGRNGGSRRGQQQSSASTGTCKCYRCGQNHHASTCKFKQYECHGCHKKGHLKSMCHSKVRFLDAQTSGEEEDEEETIGIFHTSTPVKASKEPWSTTMVIDQVSVRMEIDTSSGKCLIGKDIWKQSFPKKKLRETPVNLTTYSCEKLPLLGTCLVEVQHQGKKHRLELLVADVTNQLPIIGRDWLGKIKIDWTGVFHIKSRTLQQVLDKHEAIFEKGLGTMKKFKAKQHLKSGATPKFVKARPVPFALRPNVEVSLEKLQEGVMKKVTHSEWGSPIVVPKKTRGVRICGDCSHPKYWMWTSIHFQSPATCLPLLQEAKCSQNLTSHWPTTKWKWRRNSSTCLKSPLTRGSIAIAAFLLASHRPQLCSNGLWSRSCKGFQE